MFERLSEGFIIGELVRDAAGRVVDWRHVEVNPAWGELIGIDPAAAIGRTIRELFPRIEEDWITSFATVVETGEPIAFTRQVGSLQRWYDGRAYQVEPAGSRRFDIARPEIMGGPRATLSLSLLLHELSTNAIKYGALSTEAGRGRVRWEVETVGAERALRWEEGGRHRALATRLRLAPDPLGNAGNGRRRAPLRDLRMLRGDAGTTSTGPILVTSSVTEPAS